MLFLFLNLMVVGETSRTIDDKNKKAEDKVPNIYLLFHFIFVTLISCIQRF